MNKSRSATIKLVAIVLGLSMASCTIEFVETPESIGRDLGKLGAETWLRMNPGKGWPSSDSAAMYCAKVVEDVAKDEGWEIGQILEATNGCAEGFVEGLDKK
jgi:hypothetical protein